MPNKLSRTAESLMEAAWLAAIALTPLFFNIYSSRIFEPDKITILRSLALLAVGAWVVKVAAEGRIRWERLETGEPALKSILKIPMAPFALAVALVYIIATIFSVTPRVSLWGSYQRLQGAYTTLSYLVFFAMLLGNLRKRRQVERLITTAILVSIPISLYGFLQRYQSDPIPWGGDTTRRIASSLGNSIFVAAYLIMVFPLTVGRMFRSFSAILQEEKHLLPNVARATVYVFTATIQVIALYLSGSRGPALGWMAGSFFLFLLLSMHWRKRWMTFGIIGVAVAAGVFLAVMQIPGGPMESLRQSPAVGRFGQLTDMSSNNALVRQYIWEGAADLVAPHEPLEFPDGSRDTFNFLRPLIGYGPESMYVAYNKFYIPELGHVEKRNASPDRSHNETWDSLVITGAAGFLVYLGLFTAVFYYGFKWLNLIRTRRQRNLFLGLVLGAGLIGALVTIFWQGIPFFGVGLPFGMAGGLLLYLVLAAVFFPPEAVQRASGESARALTLIVLIAAIIAHFVEINFGIAIAATRIYFWVYAALLVLVGDILPRYGEYQAATGAAQAVPHHEANKNRKAEGRSSRSKKRHTNTGNWLNLQGSTREALVAGGIVSLIMITLGYDLISNTERYASVLSVLWNSFTRLPKQGNAASYGVLALILITWLAAAVVFAAEIAKENEGTSSSRTLAAVLGVSFPLVIIYWLWQAGSLLALSNMQVTSVSQLLLQVSQIGGLLTGYYFYIFLILLVMAFFLAREWVDRVSAPAGLGWAAAPVAFIAVFWLVSVTNLRIIHADITFKMAEPFNKPGQWEVATELYRQANRLAPNEDHYYLFLGRSYLEQAKAVEDQAEQQQLVLDAEVDLKRAQRINPLNTDHTANLARLYSWWASASRETPTLLAERAQTASDYYARAVTLSPQNSTLWGEWAILFLDVLQQPDQAYKRLEQALELDTEYSWTQGLMGDYFVRSSRVLSDTAEKNNALEQAILHYQQAVLPTRGNSDQARLSYYVALAGVLAELQRYEEAIAAYEATLALGPQPGDLWRIEETLSRLYIEIGDKDNSLAHAQAALSSAPEDQTDRLRTLIVQIQSAP